MKLVLSVIGLNSAIKYSRIASYKILLLGLAPLLFAVCILLFPHIRLLITFLKPVDVTRLLWFGNVFLIMGVGYALRAIQEGMVSHRVKLLVKILPIFGWLSIWFYLYYAQAQRYTVIVFIIILAILILIAVIINRFSLWKACLLSFLCYIYYGYASSSFDLLIKIIIYLVLFALVTIIAIKLGIGKELKKSILSIIIALLISCLPPHIFKSFIKYLIEAGLFTLFICISNKYITKKFDKNEIIIAIFALLLSILPVLDWNMSFLHTLKQTIKSHIVEGIEITHNSYFFHKSYEAEFHPKLFLEIMKPYNRMAAYFCPISKPFLQQAINWKMFCSDGRSILLHSGFRNYLSSNKMIQIGWNNMTYYFDTNNIEKIIMLGIKYLIVSDPAMFERKGFETKMYDQKDNLYLIEIIKEVKLSYVFADGTTIFLDDIKYDGNKIFINLGDNQIERATCLVLTFVDWPGWKAQVNGRERKHFTTSDCLLRINLRPGDKNIVFSFEPITKKDILFYMIASLVILISSGMVMKYSKNIARDNHNYRKE